MDEVARADSAASRSCSPQRILPDTLTGNEQTTIIALVYTYHADAEASAALFPARLEKAHSLLFNSPFGDLLADLGVTATGVSDLT